MSNSMSDDYFSFMSAKGTSNHARQRRSLPAAAVKSEGSSDTIDFVDETRIEVTESSISDTMIQRVFGGRFSTSQRSVDIPDAAALGPPQGNSFSR